MNENIELINAFYRAFQNKDFKTMQNFYSNNATFNDAVFTDLNAAQVRAMWEMLIKNGKDLKLEFSNVKANEHSGSAEWIAHYTFSATGKKVTNVIKANFVFENGKIVKHKDYFNFYAWAKQSLGTTGLLLGWTPLLKNKVKQQAMKNLENFMKKQTEK